MKNGTNPGGSQNAGDTVRRATNDPVTQFKQSARAVGDDVREMGYAAGRVAREQLDHVAEGVAQVQDDVKAKIERKPLQSIMIAAAAGALLGFLFTRKR